MRGYTVKRWTPNSIRGSMTEMSDYMREIDLNPTVNGAAAPITNPLDPRAMHYFGFTSRSQEIVFVQPMPPNPRVLASWHYGNQPTTAPIMPPPPIDAVLDFSVQPLRWDGHERAHAHVWLDPANVPALGVPVLVRVRAWA